MNKENILKRSQQEKNDEIITYIDDKTTQYASLIFIVSCGFMMILSFFSVKPTELFYTSAALLTTFLSIYFWVRYYYIRKNWSLILGIIIFIFACYSIMKVWMLIW
ncbi:MAG: DUF6442 family protein [Longibaculum sp.]